MAQDARATSRLQLRATRNPAATRARSTLRTHAAHTRCAHTRAYARTPECSARACEHRQDSPAAAAWRCARCLPVRAALCRRIASASRRACAARRHCIHARVCACVRACVRVCGCACVCGWVHACMPGWEAGGAGSEEGRAGSHRRSTMSKTRTLPVADTYATSGTDSALHPSRPSVDATPVSMHTAASSRWRGTAPQAHAAGGRFRVAFAGG
jgi:hypothetical protein